MIIPPNKFLFGTFRENGDKLYIDMETSLVGKIDAKGNELTEQGRTFDDAICEEVSRFKEVYDSKSGRKISQLN